MGQLDEIDMKILSALHSDASVSIPELSKQLGINQSVVYSRISRMQKRGVIEKFTVHVNEDQLGLKGAMVAGLNVDPKLRESVLSGLEKLEEVRLVREVTGRFDAIVDLRGSSLNDLNKTVYGIIGNLPGVMHVEVFTEVSRRIAPFRFRLVKLPSA